MFCQCIKAFKLNFRMYTLDARHLPTRLANWKDKVDLFDRIEVSIQESQVYQILS
jgi:hypothetical protein